MADSREFSSETSSTSTTVFLIRWANFNNSSHSEFNNWKGRIIDVKKKREQILDPDFFMKRHVRLLLLVYDEDLVLQINRVFIFANTDF